MKTGHNALSRKFVQIKSRFLQDIHNNHTALIILLVYFAVTQTIFHTVCPFAILTGIACPACGLTRASLLLFTGHFAAAAQLNLTVFLWVPFLLYLCIFRYFVGKHPPFALPLATVIGLLTILYYIMRLLNQNLPPVPCEGIFHLKLLVANILQCYN